MDSFAACDEMRGSLVCPKPRRIGQISPAADPIRFHLWHASHQVDPCDLKVGVELLDIFLTQEHLSPPMDSPAPFFCGSPPSRSGNPLIHDIQFGAVNPDTIVSGSPVTPIPVSATAKKGCTWTKFGFSPAAVRVEGFDSLDRDSSRSRGISAFA